MYVLYRFGIGLGMILVGVGMVLGCYLYTVYWYGVGMVYSCMYSVGKILVALVWY